LASLTNVDAGLWTPFITAGSGARRHYLNALEMLRPSSSNADGARTPMWIGWQVNSQTTR
jgi:hypothetical protein